MISLFVLIWYPLAVQYERGGWWRILALIAWPLMVLDVIANFTELVLLFGWPRPGEYTFSKRAARLRLLPGWRGDIAWNVARYLNYFSPTGDHVK